MKAQWCRTCEELRANRYKRCPTCSSMTMVDARDTIVRLLRANGEKRNKLAQIASLTT